MSIASTITKTVSGGFGSASGLISTGTKLAGELESTMSNMEKAVDSGDMKSIYKSQYEYQKAQEKFSALTQMIKSMHETVMSVIRNLGGN